MLPGNLIKIYLIFTLKQPSMKKHIPQVLTLFNVLSGCIATVFAVLNQLDYAAIFVLIGI